MRLTLLNEPEAHAGRIAGWVLDSDTPSVTPPSSRGAIRVSRKAASLLLLLASRRLELAAGSSLGWVELSEISNLSEWAGERTLTSLAAQVRREIKTLHRICPDLVEAQRGSQLKGPFRLRYLPRANRNTQVALAELHEPLSQTYSPSSSESLYSWLEQAEPVWRSFHYFDKPGEALSGFPTLDAMVADPLLKALSSIGAAKRLRELGKSPKAQRALTAAASAAKEEPHLPIRHYLMAMCKLQHAWLEYRKGDLEAAERSLASADAITSSGAMLRLQGQVLNLRSLVRRSRGLYAAALDDLSHAARLFIVEGDLLHLFAVYHNLACLIATEAAEQSDRSRRDAMLRLALTYSQRNEAYCNQYGIGQNSVLNKLLQVGLHRSLGNDKLALPVACEAERLALESQNFPDAMVAHRHRLSILFGWQQRREAKEAHEATLKLLEDPGNMRRFASIYDDELARRLAPHFAADGAKSDRVTGRRRVHSARR